ncbi:MAG: hypothetical protein R2752_07045 [Vicinamibacterales bacterium]
MPSLVHPMKSPPTRVRRHVGTEDDEAAEIVGASPPTGGTVTMNTLRFARTSARRPSGESSTSSGVGGRPGPVDGAVTLTIVFTSVPSNRIDSSPSDPAQTYMRSGSGPACGSPRPSSVSPPPTHVMRVGSPPAAGSQTYSSSAVASWLPKSSSVRIRCIFDPRTAISRAPSRV